MAHWGVLGLGSIGSLFASHLLKANESVSAVMAPARRKRYSGNALTIQRHGLSGEFSGQLPVTSSTQDLDVLLICVKAYQACPALSEIVLAPHTQLVTLNNGMGVGEQICQALPKQPLFLGTTTHGARKHEQYVEHTGIGQIYLGPPAHLKQPEPHWLAALNHAIPDSHWDANINKRLWTKLAINCAINPLTALHNCRNGGLLEAQHLESIKGVCQEVSLVAKAEGVELENDLLLSTVKQVCQQTQLNFSSMHQDIHHQRKTEIDYINGYITMCAAHHQIPVPINQSLLNRVHQMESNYA